MRNCFVAGCKTGNRKEVLRLKKAGERIPSVFSVPKDPVLFEQWQKVIPRADRKLTLKDTVCELHFREEDIDSADVIKLFDGTIYRHEKFKKRVKPGCIPSIFSNTPGHSTYYEALNKAAKGNKKSERKSVTRRVKKKSASATVSKEIAQSSALIKQVVNQDINFQAPVTEENLTEASISEENNLSEAPTIEENFASNTDANSALANEEKPVIEKPNEFLQMIVDILTKESELIQASPITEEHLLESTNNGVEQLETSGEEFNYNFVKMNQHVIKKTNSWWAINALENFIICARWNTECIVERKIIISEDLSYKVFLKEKEIKMGDDKIELKSLKNISQVIQQVENIHICQGIDNKNSNCYGFVQYGKVVCRRKNLCINCVRAQFKLEKEEKKRLREEKRNGSQHVELLRIHFRY